MYLPRLLLAIFVVGVLGVAAELIVPEHSADAKQIVPLGLAAVGLLAARRATSEALRRCHF